MSDRRFYDETDPEWAVARLQASATPAPPRHVRRRVPQVVVRLVVMAAVVTAAVASGAALVTLDDGGSRSPQSVAAGPSTGPTTDPATGPTTGTPTGTAPPVSPASPVQRVEPRVVLQSAPPVTRDRDPVRPAPTSSPEATPAPGGTEEPDVEETPANQVGPNRDLEGPIKGSP